MNQNTLIVTAIGALIALMIAVYLIRQVIRAGPLASFSRLCLLGACGVWLAVALASLFAAIYAAPGLVVIAVIALIYFGKQAFAGSGWAFGSARWAALLDLLRAGMLFRSDGLLLGTVAPPSIREALRMLRRMPWSMSETACRLFLSAVLRRPVWVTPTSWTRAVCFAGPGKGKSTGIILPYLLSCPDAMIVLDVKGDLYTGSARHRAEQFGHRIVVLDPGRIVTDTPDSFNVFDLIDKSSPDALDAVRALAEALVVRTGEERDPHFNDAAEMHIAAIGSLVLSYAIPAERNLQTVSGIISSPEQLAAARVAMRNSPAWGGMLARMGAELSHFVDRELGSAITTTTTMLRFLNSPAIHHATSTTSFDPCELLAGKMTIYLVIPPDKLAAWSGLLRLWIGALTRMITQAGPSRDRRIKMILDEAAALGRMEAIENAITQLRGYGLDLLFMYQSVSQLEKVYTQGQDGTFLASMDLTVFMGVNDPKTAQHVSERLGAATILVESGNEGEGTTHNQDQHGGGTASRAVNRGRSVQEKERRLLLPEEVQRLHERQAIVFAPNVPPCLTTLVRAHETKAFATRPTEPATGARIRLAVFSFLAFCLSAGLAAAVAAAGIEQLNAARKQPVYPAPTNHTPPQPPTGAKQRK